MDRKENTDWLTAFLTGRMEVDVAGVADLARYDRDFLGLDEDPRRSYTSAVSFGFLLSAGVLATLSEGPTPLYLHHYRQLNYRLDTVAYLLGRRIESLGYRALPFAASQLVDWQTQKAHVSHKHVGALAGIGWIGRNNLLVHPSLGAQVRYNTVLTDMPLVPDEPLAFGCGGCRSCEDACPAGAIKGEPAAFDHLGCFAMLKRFRNERNIGHYICGLCVKACGGTR